MRFFSEPGGFIPLLKKVLAKIEHMLYTQHEQKF